MKKIHLLLLFVCAFTFNLEAQIPNFEITLAHDWIHPGRDIELGVEKYHKRHVFKLGFTYFQNPSVYLHKEHSNYKRFRAYNLRQRLGLNAAYRYEIRIPKSNLELYTFAKIQINSFGKIEDSRTLDDRKVPIYNLLPTVGLLLKVKLYDKFYLFGSGGVGTFLMDKNTNGNTTDGGNIGIFDWEMTVSSAVGVSYRFEHK